MASFFEGGAGDEMNSAEKPQTKQTMDLLRYNIVKDSLYRRKPKDHLIIIDISTSKFSRNERKS